MGMDMNFMFPNMQNQGPAAIMPAPGTMAPPMGGAFQTAAPMGGMGGMGGAMGAGMNTMPGGLGGAMNTMPGGGMGGMGGMGM